MDDYASVKVVDHSTQAQIIHTETLEQLKQSVYTESPVKFRKFRQILSNQQIMTTIFRDRKVILFITPVTTVTFKDSCEALNKLLRLIQNERRRLLMKDFVFLHDNTRTNTAAHRMVYSSTPPPLPFPLTFWTWHQAITSPSTR